MKGLFLNGFYATIGNIKLFLWIVLAVGAFLLATGNPTLQELFVYITITALSGNGVISARKDAVSKWNKYEITMPVRRKEIVQCKYLSYLFWVFASTVLAGLVTAAAMLIHGDSFLAIGGAGLASMFALGIGIAVLTGGFFYPLSYLFGVEKSETALIISILAAMGFAIVSLNLLHTLHFTFSLRMGAFIAAYMLLFVCSYALSLLLYSKKEI